MKTINFNKPYMSGKELYYISQAVFAGKTSGNKDFTRKCHQFFKDKYGFKHVLMTTSCTDALEMSAILLDIKPGDEVIVPSYTFVSSANAFLLRGAKLIFADSGKHNPNIDPQSIEALITSKTKAIVVVHYAGVACDMDPIMSLANKHNIYVVEDAAQAVDSYYKDKPLGSIGNLAAFSFHETKNIISGEGGLLVVNDDAFTARSEIIWEKGTNRSAFFRGEVDKYNWVDMGSSFLPSDLISAFLLAQLEHLDEIQQRRIEIWQRYFDGFSDLVKSGVGLPITPPYATQNGHMFYLVCTSTSEREALINHLKKQEISAIFHYISLHSSPYFIKEHDGRPLENSDKFTSCLIRLPLYYELIPSDQDRVIEAVLSFYTNLD